MAAAIEGYASVTSAGPGDTVDFHVRAQAGREAFSLSIYRRGLNDTLVHSASGTAFTPGAQSDADLAVNGCDWPAVPDCRIAVPNGWKSGYYVAVATSGDATAEIPFVVRAPAGGSAPTLVKISDTTSQAYNSWGGRSLYSTPFSPRISFDRPYDSDLTLYEQYQLPFLRWAETSGRQFDYCSSLDLHQNPQQLAPYKTFLSIGHDEYWSLEERDQVEAFIAAGGNACFFSANTCFWQIRLDFSDGGRIMVCYKEAESGHPADPERDDAARVTTEWSAAPVSR
ncbi:MAG TPA: N,N-dimethylformamidase beta subunit family domain-containing protein, partial [Candidatus Baltobacteraceae bacterium]|nr:N,N-dimethylformamidase beta subunit family domain-containing protein [Candidatus Baltobacteraceae bacterium]